MLKLSRWKRVFALLVPLLASAASAQTPAPVKAVGSETCLACHDLEPAFFHTSHRTIECEECHGLGSAHVEVGGGDDSLSFRQRGSSWVVERCLSCHRSRPEMAVFTRSSHGLNSVDCLGCHQIHPAEARSKLLHRPEQSLCSDCHTAAAAGFRKPFHHPVLEGAMQCSDCHNPHAEEISPLQQMAIGTEEACLKCHSDKAGPFVFEHAPLEIGDCATCHEAHGSINAKMLRRTQVHQLCLECHTGNSDTLGSQPFSFHNLRSPRFRNCTTCHREIHGSNVSPALLR